MSKKKRNDATDDVFRQGLKDLDRELSDEIARALEEFEGRVNEILSSLHERLSGE